MRFVKILSIAILTITTTISTGFGQEVQKSAEKVRIGGDIYYVHNVKKGETIYSLTKVYGISEDELVRTNPQLTDGLKEGQVLRIPEKSVYVQQKDTRTPEGMIEHEVQRKETLYSISRQYDVSIADIKKANPTIDDNIKKGQILYIPTHLAQPEPQHVIVPIRHEKEGDDMSGEHIYHSVKKGETLYSIAQHYSADDGIIKSLNQDAFKNGALMEGAVLRIPKYEPEDTNSGVKILFPSYNYQTSNTSTPENTYSHKSTDAFNIVFLLPLSKNTEDTSLSGSYPSSEKKQNQYLQFYEGALLAVDSLKRAGLSLSISTFDVTDNQTLESALQNSSLQQAQLIVAPIRNEQAMQLASYAQRRQIPTILPASTLSDSIMVYNPYLIQLRSTPSAANHKLLENICQPNRNIVLVNHAGEDTTLFHEYNTILKEKGCTYSTLNYTIFRSRSELEAKLSPSKENHIVIASSNDQSFVIDILERLNVLLTKNKVKSHIYGSPEWRKISMNSIQVTSLYNLNLHISQPFYTDYNDNSTKEFVSKYRYYYKGEPSNYSFYGYDVCFYFLECLKTYGSNFIPFLPSNEESMLQSHFRFKQVGHGGMKNEGVFLLEYQPTLDIIRK